ncbi:SDR family NAD(P)-dependent oxidoreductase [Agromyces atrinae]|uniref:NAD(P)-dependent dehydrogenase (Short-subunit alcohol dehydrogenase family) n=1 Tax=Agromyces atrinae TaxID=592376 RepID=A0A4Q2M5D4_9MICO|nr:SDR family oxidoreductase [Agromyces atrinae]NYD66113.1 NAD(P)-dependent dehydrogenase (short-subunit alcohol dehydrogenase family) [Agromyces atrinae]RXZ86457.1 SDR family oxidoreductase [Agromyces atrinae]
MTDTPHRPVTLVTGGSRGIGAAIVRRLARDGHDIAFTYRDRRDAAEEVARDAREHGAQVSIHRVDMADLADVLSLLPAVLAEFPAVTGLVNNAGITGRIGGFLDVDLAETRDVLEINVLAPLALSQAAIAHMSTARGGRGGSIVNISSGAATTGAPGTYVPYSMSKAALNMLTVGLAKEFGPEGIRVNTVSPGTTHTDIHAAAGRPNAPAERAPNIPLRRAGEPEEIAGAVSYLLSSDASYTSGTDLRVTGGN